MMKACPPSLACLHIGQLCLHTGSGCSQALCTSTCGACSRGYTPGWVAHKAPSLLFFVVPSRTWLQCSICIHTLVHLSGPARKMPRSSSLCCAWTWEHTLSALSCYVVLGQASSFSLAKSCYCQAIISTEEFPPGVNNYISLLWFSLHIYLSGFMLSDMPCLLLVWCFIFLLPVFSPSLNWIWVHSCTGPNLSLLVF